jgi:hypothetical protein
MINDKVKFYKTKKHKRRADFGMSISVNGE